jgi:GH25 family lysozyme M1 (1,4-beta-N-acetylmuramidase)
VTAVNEYAASEMRYWCRTWDYGGVGYSQPNRWSAYDASDWQGWLKGPGEMDCSAGVAGAYNIAFHECLGEGVRPALFPRSTWTESLRQEGQARGFEDIGDSWTGSTPDGGFTVGDLLLRTTGEGGHVAMVVRDEDDSFDPWNPLVAEAWIDSAGSIYGSDGGDGSAADDSGGESRLVRYGSHPLTVSASWSTCLRYRGLSGGGAQAVPRAAGRAFGIDVSMHQRGMSLAPTGASYVVVKASEGSGYEDPCKDDFASQALAMGARLGFYHFAWPSANDVGEEVDTFVAAIRPYLDGRPFLYLDWEDDGAYYDYSWARQFLDQVHERTGIKPFIYMPASVAENGDWEGVSNDYWLWAAGYPSTAPQVPATPDCPYAPFSHGWWTLAWQYTGEGRAPGWDNDLDLNVCYRPDVLGLANNTSTDEDWLAMPAAVDYLKTIADAVTPGKAGVKYAGDLYLRLVETQAAVKRVEALLQEGGKKSAYNRLDDIEKIVNGMSADLAAVKKAVEESSKKAA